MPIPAFWLHLLQNCHSTTWLRPDGHRRFAEVFALLLEFLPAMAYRSDPAPCWTRIPVTPRQVRGRLSPESAPVPQRSENQETFRVLHRYAAMQPMNWVSIVASIIACAVVGSILWWSYARVRSRPKKALIAASTAVLGVLLFFLVQVVLEIVHPEARINGDIIAYDVNIFIVLLVLVEVAVFLLRKDANPTGTPR